MHNYLLVPVDHWFHRAQEILHFLSGLSIQVLRVDLGRHRVCLQEVQVHPMVLDLPLLRAAPSLPGIPDLPGEPGIDIPGAPFKPGSPFKPGRPAIPGGPSNPGNPEKNSMQSFLQLGNRMRFSQPEAFFYWRNCYFAFCLRDISCQDFNPLH